MRGPVFTVREVLQVAIQNEREGEAFYRKIAERTAEPAVRKLFLLLAGEEARHAKIFKQMLSKTGKDEAAKADLDEYVGYMIAYYTANLLFSANQVERLPSAPGPVAALDFGIRQELDSILYYTQAKELVSAGQAKQIDKIIAEERGHFLKFSKLKRKYLGKGG
jgi:rubrerythrin